MRCYSCNRNLNDYESTLKSATTGEYLDMCKRCLKDLDISVTPNKNNPDEQLEDEHYWEFSEVEFNPNIKLIEDNE
jgi:hypothetical protein